MSKIIELLEKCLKTHLIFKLNTDSLPGYGTKYFANVTYITENYIMILNVF